MVVLKNKISVIIPVLGIEGQVLGLGLGKDYTLLRTTPSTKAKDNVTKSITYLTLWTSKF